MSVWVINSYMFGASAPFSFGPTVSTRSDDGAFLVFAVGGVKTATASGTINNLWIKGGDTSYPSLGFRLMIYGPVSGGAGGNWGPLLGEVAFTGLSSGATGGGAMGGPVTITSGSDYGFAMHCGSNGTHICGTNLADGGGDGYFWADDYSDGANSSGPVAPSFGASRMPTIWGTS